MNQVRNILWGLAGLGLIVILVKLMAVGPWNFPGGTVTSGPPGGLAQPPGVQAEPAAGSLPTAAGPLPAAAPRKDVRPQDSVSFGPPPPAHRRPLRAVDLARLQELAGMVKKYARLHGVDEELVWAVMRQESGYNPLAVSPKGAMGLMQLMPGTAALMGVSDPFDVEQNIIGGIKYLELCLNMFNQDVCLALAAYNAGPQNVVKYQGYPPFAETRQYVVSVMRDYGGGVFLPGLRPASLNSLVPDDFPDSGGIVGLPWRVPLPQWKIPRPRVNLVSPKWKAGGRTL